MISQKLLVIKNGWLRFTNVKVSKTDIIGPLGKGLKVALATLNTGRLTIPAISTASGKACMVMTKHWIITVKALRYLIE